MTIEGAMDANAMGMVAFVLAAVVILYVCINYLYPSEAASHVVFIPGEADARKPISFKTTEPPPIYTGGDFTLSFWVYIDDWNYRVASPKFLFAISPDQVVPTSLSPLVGVLTPLQNGLMIRANTVGSGATPVTGVAAAAGATGPDITVESNLQALLNQQTSMSMFQDTLMAPCDIKEVPVQRWVSVTIVASGRVLDVYLDGKLARSCVLDNVINVPRQKLRLRLGEHDGFGGVYASVQMWNQQLTPDVIYGIYMMGPTQTRHTLLSRLGRIMNLDVTFTEQGSGTPQGTPTGTDWKQDVGQYTKRF